MKKVLKPSEVIIKLLLFIIVLGAAFFGMARTFNWPEAWIWIGLYVAWAIFIAIYLYKNNPELLKERLNTFKKYQKKWDLIVMLSGIPAYIAVFILPGLDIYRFGWTPKLPLLVEIFGFALNIAAFYIIFLTMRANTFLTRVVEIQKDRGHHVISTGPYAYVRHPMYVGIFMMFFGTPLALGSIWGLVGSVSASLVILLRTVLEDKTLQNELPGYKEYTQKVKYRIIPGIW